MAFGVGANTAMFTLVDQVLLRQLPVERPADPPFDVQKASKEVARGQECRRQRRHRVNHLLAPAYTPEDPLLRHTRSP